MERLAVPDPHYDRVAAALHWLIGAALLGQVAFGFLLDDIAPAGTPSRGAVINLHKSFGIVLGVLIVLRLAWRLAHRPPALPRTLPDWQRAAARWSHRALYACMIVMPVSGYVASNFSRHGVVFFGLTLSPWGPDLKPVYRALNGVHVITGWIFAALIAVHVLAALQHAWQRDAVFRRMWPWGARRAAPSAPAPWRDPQPPTTDESTRSQEIA
jgi:cytochrome b561